MSSYKMVYVASALVLGWMGVAAVCFSNLATVPANLAIISHQKPASTPAPAEPPAAALSVASGEHAPTATATP